MRLVRALVPIDEPGISDPFAAIAAASAVAARAGTSASAILVGAAIGEDAIQSAARHGAAHITLCRLHGTDTPPNLDQWVAVFAGLAADPAIDILPAGSVPEEIAARLALRLGATPLGRCLSVTVEGGSTTIRRATHGGRGEAVFTTQARHLVATMQAPRSPPSCCMTPAISRIALPLPSDIGMAFLHAAAEPPHGRRLDSARIVVSGGRGMGGPDGFAQLGAIASCLGAATAASLPAVDAGWATVAQQVGQSGTFVAPDIYLAVGLSGTAQHMAGIGQATRILAINADADADIFKVAEVGIVARWQDVLPGLFDALKEQKTGERP